TSSSLVFGPSAGTNGSLGPLCGVCEGTLPSPLPASKAVFVSKSLHQAAASHKHGSEVDEGGSTSPQLWRSADGRSRVRALAPPPLSRLAGTPLHRGSRRSRRSPRSTTDGAGGAQGQTRHPLTPLDHRHRARRARRSDVAGQRAGTCDGRHAAPRDRAWPRAGARAPRALSRRRPPVPYLGPPDAHGSEATTRRGISSGGRRWWRDDTRTHIGGLGLPA